MAGLTHAQIWRALDLLAARLGLSPSGLARAAGLDPTSFNPSKRLSNDTPPRPRWPSTESLAKVLQAAGMDLTAFAALAEGRAGDSAAPVIGFAQAGAEGYFDDAGFPVGQGWDRVAVPGPLGEGAYALEISGESMLPVYRPGDRIVVAPGATDLRRGDRVVVRTLDGEVMAKEIARVTPARLELRSLNPAYPGRVLARDQIAWIGRILWASQ